MKANPETDLDYQTGDEDSNAIVATKRRTFNKQALGPFSEGIRMMWVNMTDANDHVRHIGAMLIYMLIQLESAFRVAVDSKMGTEDDCWREAKRAILILTEDKRTFRVAFIEWLDGLKKKRLVTDAVDMASEILDEAAAEDMDPDPDTQQPNASTTTEAVDLKPGK